MTKKKGPGSHAVRSDEQRVAELEKRLGARFADRSEALVALTHSSYLNEHKEEQRDDNERLEWLGDAVVDLAITHRLMERLPRAREGELSRLRAAIVDEEGLSLVARAIGLGELLLLGHGEEMSGGREKSSLLSDAFEAVSAVVYQGGGMAAVLELVDRLFAEQLDRAEHGALGRDFKTALQETAQSQLKTSPRYRLVSESGPDHAKVFVIEVELAGTVRGRGEGRTKKEAEQAAACEALASFPKSPEGPSRS